MVTLLPTDRTEYKVMNYNHAGNVAHDQGVAVRALHSRAVNVLSVELAMLPKEDARVLKALQAEALIVLAELAAEFGLAAKIYYDLHDKKTR